MRGSNKLALKGIVKVGLQQGGVAIEAADPALLIRTLKDI